MQAIENMVARDGVEPPTPAFSGLRTTSLSLPFFNNLTLQSWPQFCDHSVTSADVRLASALNTNNSKSSDRVLVSTEITLI